MLTIRGPESRFCDGISRRSCLRIGALGMGGLALPGLLRAEAKSDVRNPARGIIMLVLPGGPPHLDMYDLKPDAPAEIRGEFQPIPTTVPGLEICELMPRLARIADKLTIFRALVGARDDHNTHWCTTGWESHPAMESSQEIRGYPPGDWPSLGSVLAKTFGARVPGVPPSVDVTPKYPDARFMFRTPPGHPGYLGTPYAGFEVDAVERHDIMLNGVSLDRLSDRQTLLGSFDRFRRKVDQANDADGIESFNRQAFEVLASPRLADALDLSREEPAVRRRYGLDRSWPGEREGKTMLHQFLLARRVIEAGARCVTLTFSRWPFGRILKGDNNWDWHKDNFDSARGTLPLLDLGLSTLIEDLSERGLLDDIAVVAWGEFGRSPKINSNAGRDHWPPVAGGLVAGGGMRCGQVIGSTTCWGEEALARPVHFRDVFATLYELLGIDTRTTQFLDLAGRPQYLVGDHRPLPELIS